ncbi:MAG: hypothetical protein WC797_01170 [Candidatus Paceibacterota bacterium]|jgi:hypothetical protein
MALSEYIKNLQEKPEEDRQRILYISCTALTALIFIIWFFVRFYEWGWTIPGLGFARDVLSTIESVSKYIGF